jgi:hypothetical protein
MNASVSGSARNEARCFWVIGIRAGIAFPLQKLLAIETGFERGYCKTQRGGLCRGKIGNTNVRL